MKQLPGIVVVAALCGSVPMSAQRASDPKAEVVAVAYAYAVQIAERDQIVNDEIGALKNKIERLSVEIRKGKAAESKTLDALNAAKLEFVRMLEQRSREYADQLADVKRAAEDVLASPEGAAAVAMFNAGNQVEGLRLIDKLTDLKIARLQRAKVRFAPGSGHRRSAANRARL